MGLIVISFYLLLATFVEFLNPFHADVQALVVSRALGFLGSVIILITAGTLWIGNTIHENQYQNEVSQWIEADSGLTLQDDDVEKLINGEVVSVKTGYTATLLTLKSKGKHVELMETTLEDFK